VIFFRQLALLAVLGSLSAHAQSFDFDRTQTKNSVSYLAEPVIVTAGKPSDVKLYFRIANAIHINSHAPFASELIPTTLTMQPVADVKVGRMEFPVGTKYAFSFAPKEKLSVYSGDFVVKVRVTVAHAGSYTLNGSLQYQACDNAQCYPPKSLPVSVILNAR
jgi:hypothetical protein